MAGVALQSDPVTPKKRDPRGFDLLIDKLNNDYGLHIRKPDHSLSPRKRQLQRPGPDETTSRIYKRLHVHFCDKTGEDTIKRILDEFHEAVTAVLRGRLSRQHTGFSSRPRTPQSLRATTAEERQEWEALLTDVLEQHHPTLSPQRRRLFRRVQSGPANYHVGAFDPTHGIDGEPRITDPSVAQPKRHSDDWSDELASMKRPKADHCTAEPSRSAAKLLDAVPVRTKPGPLADETTPYIDRSTTTSKTSFRSDVFSPPDGVSRTSSQTTIEASPRDRSRENVPQWHSQDSFPVSSGVVGALHESFSRFDGRTNPLIDERPNLGTDIRDQPTSSMLYPSLPLSDFMLHDVGVNEPGLGGPPLGSPTVHCPVDSRLVPTTVQDRLKGIWPSLPLGLENVPFPILWEVTRVALHCGVELQHTKLEYHSDWHDQNNLWRALHEHPSFRNKAFPPRSDERAWQASFSDFFSRGQAVVFVASMDWGRDASGPMFSVRLHPLALDDSYRLGRRFGPDRFLELICPSLYSGTVPAFLQDNDDAVDQVIHWLVREPHWFLGRQWAPFYLKDVGYKKPSKEVRLGPEPKPVVKDRIYLFAEDGSTFTEPRAHSRPSTKDEVKSGVRTKLKLPEMLEWSLELTRNTEQPCLKLFQRTALVLSKTIPTIVFRPGQIRHVKKDLLSPTGIVMNDGAARMSRGVALRLRDLLGLTDIPCAVQGRLGSAKGMWVIDVTDQGDDHWIETYPSQRKWICSPEALDEDHRTLEIRAHPREPRSAHFNLQLLPILEDRAVSKDAFYEDVGNLLRSSLEEDLKSLKESLRSPIQSRQWNHENSSRRHERIERGQVAYLGGLPVEGEETINIMLDSGFDPTEQKYLQELFWQAQKRKCDDLQKRLRIEIGCSTHLYMIPDFLGILEEGEIHVSFSSKFQAGDFSDTILHGIDVLVARNPAHYPSDVQKVKARFCPELHALKNVVVFPTRGNSPLADLLSGGDYDGDMAWICWDPRLVNNFENAPMPRCPDLIKMGYLSKDKETLGQLILRHGMPLAATEMLVKGFSFNMRGSLLGICTNYKERLCYKRNSVNDRHAITMSTLVSHLVDQAKQGIGFTVKDFNRLIRDYLKETRSLEDPAYKLTDWDRRSGQPRHIIDKLKFDIARPAIERELQALHKGMKTSDVDNEGRPKSRNGHFDERQLVQSEAEYWDPDLASYDKDFAILAETSRSCKELLDCLKKDLRDAEATWKETMAGPKAQDDLQFSGKVLLIYETYKRIQPRTNAPEALQNNSKTTAMLLQPSLDNWKFNQWALLKASVGYKLFYRRSAKFIWRMAGIQLCWLKALKTRGQVVPVISTQYAILRPDPKTVKQIAARQDDNSTVYDDDVERDEDDE